MSTTLQDLVNRAVFFSTEMQTHFGALIADAAWEVDFTSDPHLTFTSDEGVVLRARPHLLGSESSGQSTWLWGWENINEFPEAVVGLSHDVRKFGAAEEVAELTTAELELDEELALRLTLAAKEATGKWTHYPAGAGAGTTVWLLVDAPELTLPEPQVKVSVRALMQGLTQTTVTDHRIALESYASKRGIPSVPLPEEGLRLLFADGSADLSFDDQRRISNCDMNTPLEGEAAEQFAAASTGSPAEAAAASSASVNEAPAAAPAAPAEPAVCTAEEASPAVHAPAAAGTREETRPAAAASARAEDGTAPTDDDATTGTPEVDTQAPAAAAADQAPAHETSAHDGGDQNATEKAPETAETSDDGKPADDKPKKKGLFSKLFGR